MKTKKCLGAAFSALIASAAASPAAAQTSGQVVAEGCTAVTVDARPGVASARDPSCPPMAAAVVAAPATKKVWYGWQTLTTDGAALVILAATASRAGDEQASALGLASLAVYSLGTPVVHAANGSPSKMGISLGMRLGAPVVLGAGGYYACGGGDGSDWGAALCGATGVLLGIAGAVAVDASVLARKKVEPDAAAPVEPRNARLRVMPTANPVRGGAAVGLVGTF